MGDVGSGAKPISGGGGSARALTSWLKEDPVHQLEGPLSYAALSEAGVLDRPAMVGSLAKDVVRNYLAPGELAAVFDDLGTPEVASYLRENKFPSWMRTRHGDFGEIVTGAHYRLVERWCVPILKVRYKQTGNQAVQGTDVLAFRFRQQPPIVAVVEVKTRTARDKQVGPEAHESLEAVLTRLDESFAFAMARCLERGHGFLARRLGALIREPDDRTIERHMVFVHDAAAWKEDVVDLLAERVTEPTELTVVKIDELRSFILEIYAAAESAPSQGAKDQGASA
ncbi:hypothetical protein [Glycomyces salinus]|uniref:hypothetical protein n=1 Tax=Glycomyces salinus TaxID=980294 RepID=UPI0018EA88CB|nr:hypothetical protein [Glycomyces salinus]